MLHSLLPLTMIASAITLLPTISPRATKAPTGSATGSGSGSGSGENVQTLRSRFDVDGDGLDERVAGTVKGFVIRYSASGRAEEFLPEARESEAPMSVTAGDFDADGYADLVFGDPSDNRDNPAIRDQGAVWVCSGSAAGLAVDACRHISQNSPGVPGTSEFWDAFGSSVAAGDLNHDGYADLAVGTSNEQLTEGTGAVTVLWGSRTGLRTVGAVWLDQNLSWVPGTAEFLDGFGAGVAIGDVTGDRYADLAISSPGEDNQGSVTVLRGASTGLAHTGATRVRYTDLNQPDMITADMGYSLVVADLNRDGRAEVITGSPSAPTGDLERGGVVIVLNGTAAGITKASFRALNQDTPGVPGITEDNDGFGVSLATGDVTGDGYADLLIGAPGEQIGDAPGAGMVTLLRGSANGVTGAGSAGFHQDQAAVPGVAETSDQFGASVSILNRNGTGGLDAMAGAPTEDIGTGEAGLDAGSVTDFTGGPAGLSPTGAWNPIGLEAEFGHSFGHALGRSALTF